MALVGRAVLVRSNPAGGSAAAASKGVGVQMAGAEVTREAAGLMAEVAALGQVEACVVVAARAGV